VANAEVLVVAPALNSRLHRWLSDEDAARRTAEDRVTTWVDQLRDAGVPVQGRVGDGEPLQAIADALVTFNADEIVIVARSDRASRRADELVSKARRRFGLPVGRAGHELPRPVYTARTYRAGIRTPSPVSLALESSTTRKGTS
jgi:nucleotide-binding universal stress UspA family protein